VIWPLDAVAERRTTEVNSGRHAPSEEGCALLGVPHPGSAGAVHVRAARRAAVRRGRLPRVAHSCSVAEAGLPEAGLPGTRSAPSPKALRVPFALRRYTQQRARVGAGHRARSAVSTRRVVHPRGLIMLVTPLVYHSAALLRIPTQSKSYRSVGCCVSLRRAKGPTPARPHTRPAPHPPGPTPARARAGRARGRPPRRAVRPSARRPGAADLYRLARIYG
jgi:hypothetical protein